MEWKKSVRPSQRRGHVVYFSTTAEAATWSNLHEIFAELFEKLCSALPEEYGSELPLDWDAIFLEVWVDGGRVIAYPGPKERDRRIDRANVQVSVPLIEQEYYKIQTPDRANDDEFNRQFAALNEKILRILATAATTEPAAETLKKCKTWHLFKLYALEMDDESTTVEIPI